MKQIGRNDTQLLVIDIMLLTCNESISKRVERLIYQTTINTFHQTVCIGCVAACGVKANLIICMYEV